MALAADTTRRTKGTSPGYISEIPLLAGAQIYKGALVSLDANGYGIAATDTAGTYVVGVALENRLGVTNGVETVKVEYGRLYRFACTGIDRTMMGEPAYVRDDNTVDNTSTNGVVAGIFVEYISTTACWVLVNPSYQPAFSAMTASAAELNYNAGVTPGTVTASKTLIVDANKDIASLRDVTLRNLTSTNVDAGASGTAGTVDVFPTTGSKGKLALTCADQAGDTTVTFVADAMAAARTIHLPDPGATSYILQSTATGVATTATAPEISGMCDISTRLVAAGGTETCAEATHEGRITCLDTASGSVVTLPAATGSGGVYRFLVTTTCTSNDHIIKVTGNDTMVGLILMLDNDSNAITGYSASGTDDTITLNRTTTGGTAGDWFILTDMAADLWHVQGFINVPTGSNVADPLSATV